METLETPTTLGNLSKSGDSTDRQLIVLRGYNLGNNSLVASIPFLDFLLTSEVANERGISENRLFEGEPIAQRKLNSSHASGLATYILKGIVNDLLRRYETASETPSAELVEIRDHLGQQPYFSLQPIVANIRTCQRGGGDLRAEKSADPFHLFRVFLSNRDVLWVVDGQHRRYAISLLVDYLQTVQTRHQFPKRSTLYTKTHDGDLTPAELKAWLEIFSFMRTDCTLVVEIHLGLNAIEERQLFHDLNNLGKKVDSNLVFDFDSANPINRFIKDNLSHLFTAFSHKDLIGINALLFMAKTNVRGAQPYLIEQRAAIAERFWKVVSAIPGFGHSSANAMSDLVVLKALARVTHDIAWGKNANWTDLEDFYSALPKMNFEYSNPLWRYYDMDDKERNKHKIGRAGAYLPKPPRNLGKWDEKTETFEFSNKHNDIYPIIGDMVRWSLGLPKRPESLSK